MFTNQKIFLDVKDYSRIDQLEANIRQRGGLIEKFLSKEITCVVTNRTKTDNYCLQKSAFASPSNLNLCNPACGSRVMSRGQSLLMRSNSLKDVSVRDPVAFAQTWGIKIVTLDAVVEAIDSQLLACGTAVPVSQSTQPLGVWKRRKCAAPAAKLKDPQSNAASFVTEFMGSFIKFEDLESNFRPFFHQYSTYPHLDLDGNLSGGLFKCGENPVSARKSTAVGARKQKISSRRGFCECCDIMYDDLNEHLVSTEHQNFVRNVHNFSSLDKLVDEIVLAINSVPFPTEDLGSTKTEPIEEEMRSSSHDNPSAAVDPYASVAQIQSFNQLDCQGEVAAANTDTNAVVNLNDSDNVLAEETLTYSANSVSVGSTGVVNSVDNTVVDDESHGGVITACSQSLQTPDNATHMSMSVSQSVSGHETAISLGKEMSQCKALSRSDDMPNFISSDCIVNLLELLSSDSIRPAESAESCTFSTDKSCKSGAVITSMEIPHMPVACGSKTCGEVPGNITEPFAAVQVEENAANVNVFQTESTSVTLPVESDLALPCESESSVINNGLEFHDARSCNAKIDGDVTLLPHKATLFVDEPATSATTVKVETALPVCSEVNDVSMLSDDFLSSVHCDLSDLVANSFQLHDKLLTVADGMDASDNDRQWSHSLAQASYPRLDTPPVACASYDNNLMYSPSAHVSEGLPQSASCSLCTPIRSCSVSPENRHMDSDISAEFYRGSLLSGYCSVVPAHTTDSLYSSVPYITSHSDTELNDFSEKPVSLCTEQENGHCQISSHPVAFVETETKSEVAVICSLSQGSEGCDKADTIATVDADPCCATALCGNISDSSVLASESSLSDVDSASTVLYDCNSIASPAAEQFSNRASCDKIVSDTAAYFQEVPCFDNTNCRWKVISFADCRMRLARTELAPVAQNEFETGESWVGQRNMDEITDAAEFANDNISDVAHAGTCDCPLSLSAVKCDNNCENESETNDAGLGKPFLSTANCTWKVISFADGRMTLVRSDNTAYSAVSTLTPPSLCGRYCYTENSQNSTSKLLLAKTSDSVLTC